MEGARFLPFPQRRQGLTSGRTVPTAICERVVARRLDG